MAYVTLTLSIMSLFGAVLMAWTAHQIRRHPALVRLHENACYGKRKPSFHHFVFWLVKAQIMNRLGRRIIP